MPPVFLPLLCGAKNTPTYEGLGSVLWMQRSLEYKASAEATYRCKCDTQFCLREGVHFWGLFFDPRVRWALHISELAVALSL